MRKFTAEDVLESVYDKNDYFSSLEKLEFIQIYAKKVAEQALKDAAETNKQVDGVTVLFSDIEQSAILSTPIVTT